MIVAEVFKGEADTADVFLIVATVLFIIAGLIALAPSFNSRPVAWSNVLGYFGLAAVAFALALL